MIIFQALLRNSVSWELTISKLFILVFRTFLSKFLYKLNSMNLLDDHANLMIINSGRLNYCKLGNLLFFLPCNPFFEF